MPEETSNTPIANDPVTTETKIPTTDTPVSEVPAVPGEPAVSLSATPSEQAAIADGSTASSAASEGEAPLADSSAAPIAPDGSTTAQNSDAVSSTPTSQASLGADTQAGDASTSVPLETAVAAHLEAIFKLVKDASTVKAAAATGAAQEAHDAIVDIEGKIQNGQDVGSHEVMSLVGKLRVKLKELF